VRGLGQIDTHKERETEREIGTDDHLDTNNPWHSKETLTKKGVVL
jgi:hypothetical protein